MKLASWILPRAVLLSCLIVAAPLPAAAQGVGEIGGIVTDASGGALPGATVALTSAQGTVGGSQETVADERGAYQFTRLVPGTYAVRASLQGFRSVQQENVAVVADAAARADLRLEVGALEETLTVTGQMPLLDTTRALQQTVISREELSLMPNRSDVWSMSRMVPGIVMNNLDVGGTERFFQGFATARGRNSENKTLIDGTDISSMTARGTTNMIYPDPHAFEQTSIMLGGGAAEFFAGGVVYNMTTRSGTNAFHGGVNLQGTTPYLAKSRNVSPELREQLLRNVPARVLAANPGISVSPDIQKDVDAGGWLAGPILRDKLWFAATWRDQRLDRYVIGNYDPSGQQVLDDNVMWTTSAKISWQINRGAQLSYFNNTQYKLIGHRAAGTFYDSRATQYNYKYPTVNQVKFTSPMRSNMAVDVVYSRFRADDVFGSQPEVRPGDVATNDTITQALGSALATYNVNRMTRDTIKGNLSWFLGAHDLKMGYEYQHNTRDVKIWSTSGMRSNFANGVPTSVNTYLVTVTQANDSDGSDVPWLYSPRETVGGAFVQDRWNLHRKVTVNLGLRFDTQSSRMGETCRPDTVFLPGQCYAAVEAPSFKDAAPRFNLVWDVNGDGRTALKFAVNRYNQPIAVQIVERLNPLAGGNNLGQASSVTNQRQWLPQSRCNDPGVVGCDRNGDLIPQLNEIGPSPGYVLEGVNAFYDPDLQREVSNEYSVEFQRQLPQEVVLSTSFVRSETRRNIGSRNTAAPPETWIGPITVTERNSGETVQVWNRGTAAAAFLNYNDPDLDLTYHGVDVTASKRMSNRWSLTAGGSFGRARVKSRGGNRSDPNVLESPFDTGVPFGDRPWSYRASGVYELPWQLFLSGTWQYMIGAPETTTVLVTNQTIQLAQGNQSVVVRPIGDVRLPNVSTLDLSLRRRFNLGSGRMLSPRIDVFNATNEATIDGWVSQLGPAYHSPSSVQRGRLIKFELAYDF
jgi:hypothetical protein